MPEPITSQDVSIRYTLTLEDGTLLSRTIGGDRFIYESGRQQAIPGLEEALRGAVRGERRQVILSATQDPSLRLAVTRLAHLLGHAGENLILDIEVL
jgi:hypothetical protein